MNKPLIKQIIAKSCILFTILTVFIYSIAAIAQGKIDGWIPKLDTIFMILVFSFAIIISDFILVNKKISFLLRLIVHYLTLGIVYYFIFVIWAGFASNGGTTLIALIIYTIVYAIIMLIKLLLTKSKNKKENKKVEYSSMFSKD